MCLPNIVAVINPMNMRICDDESCFELERFTEELISGLLDTKIFLAIKVCAFKKITDGLNEAIGKIPFVGSFVRVPDLCWEALRIEVFLMKGVFSVSTSIGLNIGIAELKASLTLYVKMYDVGKICQNRYTRCQDFCLMSKRACAARHSTWL